MLGRVPPSHRDKASEHKERARRFLSDEYFPPERRDQLIYRFKKVVIECQNHKDYQESMRWLLDTGAEYIGHGRVVADHGKCLTRVVALLTDMMAQARIPTSNSLRTTTFASRGTSSARCWSASPMAQALT